MQSLAGDRNGMRDQNFTDSDLKGRVLPPTSTNDYYVPGEYFLGYVSIIQSFGKMRRGSWSRQHEHLSQTFNRLRLCCVWIEVIAL